MSKMNAEIPRFHDAHSHAVEAQAGGFLIAIEGEANLPYMLSNEDVQKQQDESRLLFAVPYVRYAGEHSEIEGPIVKYHARREGFPAEWVSRDIAHHRRKLALLDTLNAIDWETRDYLDLARDHPKTLFLFCHGGGYDILEFLKMARFMPNVWIDFSATQEIFGWVGNSSNFPAITGAIDHAFAEHRIARKLMFGSDTPGFKQVEAVQEAVRRRGDASDYLTGNFERLISLL
jgi:hypothetical protein